MTAPEPPRPAQPERTDVPRLSPEQARQVLEERARELARVPAQPPDAAQVVEVVTFALGDEQYAIEARFVRRVVRPSTGTLVPGTPGYLVGIINLRGEILAVFDLHALFGLGPGTAARVESPLVLVLGGERDEFGVTADSVGEVVCLRNDGLHEPTAPIAGFDRTTLLGVTADARVVLNGATLLRDTRLFINQGDEPGPETRR